MHTRIFSLLATIFMTSLSHQTAFAQTADQPVPRTDANSKLAHQQMLENLKKGRIDVYFAGDSITRRWRATDYPQFLANWNENFIGWDAANFGWGADNIQNILWRLQNGELDGVHPKVIVLLAGTNNVGNSPASDAKVSDITKGIKALLDTMRDKAPKATIIVMGILPRNDGAKPTAVMTSINKINENIAKLADGKTIRYLNINDKLADKDGKLFEGMSGDRLHLSLKGYQVWADALKPVLTELLGPPAKEDHAPPPTGDPSAKKKAPAKASALHEMGDNVAPMPGVVARPAIRLLDSISGATFQKIGSSPGPERTDLGQGSNFDGQEFVMGMHLHVRAVRSADLPRLQANGLDLASPLQNHVPHVHLQKAWHGLHYLLTGSAGEGGLPLGFLLEGGREVGQDLGYGSPRLFEPGDVQHLNAALAPITEDELWSRFDPIAMEAEGIYPVIWDEDEEELREEYVTYFLELKKVVAQASAGGMGLLVILN
jgi:lysophospholipase L1-like esterase